MSYLLIILFIVISVTSFIVDSHKNKFIILVIPSLLLLLLLGGIGYYLLHVLGGDEGWVAIIFLGMSIPASVWLLLFNYHQLKQISKNSLANDFNKIVFINTCYVLGSIILGCLTFSIIIGIVDAVEQIWT